MAFVFVACGSNEPKDVAIDFIENAYKGNGNKLFDYIYLNEESMKEAGANEMVETKLQVSAAQVSKQAENTGGIKNIEVTAEDVKEKMLP